MNSPVAKLSPRQRDCLRLVYDRQATSKEISAELGISKSTVDGYLSAAVELLGARDRRHAALLAFGDTPRAGSGTDPARVTEPALATVSDGPSTNSAATKWAWRTSDQPRNAMTLAQTVMWTALIAIASLVALTLAISIGNGAAPLVQPLLHAFDRLTH